MIGRQVRPATLDLLARNDLSLSDVDAWAIHPGGPAILESVREALSPDEALEPSREVLKGVWQLLVTQPCC